MKKGEIGRRIKGSRVAKDISTKEMAEYVGVTPQRINSIERGLDEEHTVVKILMFLRKQGVDLNLIFEKDN